MSNYSYRCLEHGDFTVNRSIKDEPLHICIVPGCNKEVVQVFASPMVKVSCSGFCGKIDKS